MKKVVKKTKKNPAGYPVLRKFTIDTGTSDGDVYVDIGQCLSLINHRLYRQGKLYRVRVSITSPSSMQMFAVTSLPDTWWARTAYNKVRDLWMSRVAAKKKLEPKSVARWNDFKVAYDATHRTNFTSAKKPLLVTDATGTQAAMASSNEEWNLSELLDKDGDDNTFRMLSTSTTSNVVNIIQAYSNLDNIFSPDPSETGSGSNIYAQFDRGNAGDDSDMDDQGDYPPYHETDFPQLEVHQGQLLAITIDGGDGHGGVTRFNTGYFDAPLGLLRIYSGADAELTIEVQEGDYKGVKAPDWK